MNNLTWAAFGAFVISTLITLYVHRKLVKHIFNYQQALAEYQHKNDLIIENFRKEYQTAISKMEMENSRKITKIEYENERLLMKIEREYEVRQKSIVVAELLALWFQTFSTSRSCRELTKDEYKRLNQLSFECGLWLPKSILEDLSDKLAEKEGAKDIKQILVDVRYHLNENSDKVDWKKIIHF
jgi:hypothetical protein